jgi:hypothetical protein
VILPIGFDTIGQPVTPLQSGAQAQGLSISLQGFSPQAFGTALGVNTYSPSGSGGGNQTGPPNTPIAVKVYIAGVDRTAYVTVPLRRSWQLGSICTATFLIDSSLAGSYRPDEWDSVVIVLGTYLFFNGVVDNYSELWRYGGSDYRITVNCLGWAALLDRRYLGIDIVDATGATTAPIPAPVPFTREPGDISAYWYAQPLAFGALLPQQPKTLSQLLAFIQSFLADAGITFQMAPGTDGPLSEQTFNWLSISQILHSLESQFGILFMIDMYKTIQVIDLNNGRGPAPAQILDSNGSGTSAGAVPLWQQMEIQRGGMYRNRQGERTSQQLNSSYQVTDPNGIITDHSSRLSYVAWADDPTEEARIGFVVETIDDAKDVQDKSVLDAMATADLTQGAKTLIKTVINATLPSFEPGQVLTINTSVPPIAEDLLIEQVDSESAGPLSDGSLLMRNVVQANNSRFRRGAGLAYQQNLHQAATVPAIPLTSWGVFFYQAETIDGITNPGLVSGLKALTPTAPRKGVASFCQWVCAVAPANDVNVDILADGVSIFASGRIPIIRAGQIFMENTDYAFAADPLKIPPGTNFQQNVLTDDADFRDGYLQVMFAG